MAKRKVLLLGPPGSGKGTQAELLSKKYHVPHISTGNILRDEIRENTMLGKKIKAVISRGILVQDDVMAKIIKKRLGRKDCTDGFILDGFPRNLKQAKDLESMGVRLDAAFLITSSEEMILRRLGGRRTCPKCERVYNIFFKKPMNDELCDECKKKLFQRDDDKEDVIRRRLKEYIEQTAPLIGYYKKKGILYEINGEEPIPVIFGNISSRL